MLNSKLEGKKVDEEELKQSTLLLAKNSVNSKDYEYWTAVFSLYKDLGEDSEICFYLKDTFNPHKNSITTKADLEKFKQDPPDLLIKHKSSGYAEFELKRYRGELTEEGLFAFIKDKVLRYSSSLNYCIILQCTPGTKIPKLIFENLHTKLKALPMQRDLSRICLLFNANNQFMIFAHIYPDFNTYKKPFISGSDQIKNL